MSSQTSASPVPPSASAPVVAEAPKKSKKAAATTKPKPAKAAATKPKAKKSAAKPTPAHPSWKDIITECIVNSDDKRKGVSRNALKKYAEDQYKLSTPAHISQLNRALASGIETGIFVQPKGPSGCVKLAPKVSANASKENSKPVSKSSTAKKAVVKAKATPTKKPTTALKAKKAVVGKKVAPATKAAVKSTTKSRAPKKVAA
ncbi:hypothetical protein B0H19DRAFT_1165298 [Mycena capillaripes]|nr:hypothetical protein B0H19DRAFT_1165298 [Mycena capillaripes]